MTANLTSDSSTVPSTPSQWELQVDSLNHYYPIKPVETEHRALMGRLHKSGRDELTEAFVARCAQYGWVVIPPYSFKQELPTDWDYCNRKGMLAIAPHEQPVGQTQPLEYLKIPLKDTWQVGGLEEGGWRPLYSYVCVVASVRPWEGKWQIKRDGKVYERDTEAEVLYKGYLLAGYSPGYEQSWLLELGDRLLQRLRNSVPMDTGTLELWVPEGEVYTRLALGWLAAQARIQAHSRDRQGDVRWGTVDTTEDA